MEYNYNNLFPSYRNREYTLDVKPELISVDLSTELTTFLYDMEIYLDDVANKEVISCDLYYACLENLIQDFPMANPNEIGIDVIVDTILSEHMYGYANRVWIDHHISDLVGYLSEGHGSILINYGYEKVVHTVGSVYEIRPDVYLMPIEHSYNIGLNGIYSYLNVYVVDDSKVRV